MTITILIIIIINIIIYWFIGFFDLLVAFPGSLSVNLSGNLYNGCLRFREAFCGDLFSNPFRAVDISELLFVGDLSGKPYCGFGFGGGSASDLDGRTSNSSFLWFRDFCTCHQAPKSNYFYLWRHQDTYKIQDKHHFFLKNDCIDFGILETQNVDICWKDKHKK